MQRHSVIDLTIAPLLDKIAAEAREADKSRSISPQVINALKNNEIMGFTAARSLGGLSQSCVKIGQELEAVAAACSSTAWCLWNHLSTFHLFCGLLGPRHADFLSDIVKAHEWVCFPAGASTAVKGSLTRDEISLQGKAAFGSGARYGEWAGVSFMNEDDQTPSFSMVDLRQAGVNIDQNWFAMSLRASATDTVGYEDARIPATRRVDFPFMYRVAFRDPERPMIAHRYREDWVALSDMWLGCMAVGVTQAALDEVATGIKDRVAIMGVKVAQRPTVHVNLGQAQARINGARDTAYAALAETDERIEAEKIPDETDYLRQLSVSMNALQQCEDAMRLLLRVMGGNGLREGQAFERRFRDLQAMPLHINAHQDRVSEQLGRHLLGLPTDNPF
ncbi:MAG: acyl-CoA dehydrogenase family protein [Candidatus Azotimanducaceae bacterium WSBS_2022_MAG_OTU7]